MCIRDRGELLDIAFTNREMSELRTIITIAAHLFFTCGFFLATKLFYRPEAFSTEEKKQVDKFFVDIETEFVSDDKQKHFDDLQSNKLGNITLLMGTTLFLMCLISNPLWGRVLFALCGLSIIFIGYMLKPKSVSYTHLTLPTNREV